MEKEKIEENKKTAPYKPETFVYKTCPYVKNKTCNIATCKNFWKCIANFMKEKGLLNSESMGNVKENNNESSELQSEE